MSFHANEGAPAFIAPPLSCDTHFHVFGAAGQYPYGGGLRYQPPHAPLETYLDLSRHLGVERFVFVQPSAYARDNRCMLDAMRTLTAQRGAACCRGIVDIDEDIPDAELRALHAAGVRGVRINVSPVHAPTPGLADSMIPRIRKFEDRFVALGLAPCWQLDFLLPGWLTLELMPVLASLKIDFTLAHMGMFLAKDGPAQAGFRALLDLIKNGSGRAHVKLTGSYRMGTLPSMADCTPMAQALIEAAPDRIIWGSDYPHLSFAGKVGSVQLFNLLADWAPDAKVRQKILVENPQRLFGF